MKANQDLTDFVASSKQYPLPSLDGILDQFVSGKSNHGSRNGSDQFQSKATIQSLQGIAIGFLHQSSSRTQNGFWFWTGLNACLDQIKGISNAL